MSKFRNTNEMEPWKKKMNEIIFGSETVAGKWFDIILLIAILFSVIAIFLDSVPEYHNKYGSELRILEWAFTVLFSIEYVARIISVKKPAKYIFFFLGDH